MLLCPTALAAKIASCGKSVWQMDYPWYHIAEINVTRLKHSQLAARLTSEIKYIKYYTGMCNYGQSSFHLCDDKLNEIVKLNDIELMQIDLYDAVEPYLAPVKAIK